MRLIAIKNWNGLTALILTRHVCLTPGGQRCISTFAQRVGERGGQTQSSRGRERAAPAEDHRGGDLQASAAQRAGEGQRGEPKDVGVAVSCDLPVTPLRAREIDPVTLAIRLQIEDNVRKCLLCECGVQLSLQGNLGVKNSQICLEGGLRHSNP